MGTAPPSDVTSPAGGVRVVTPSNDADLPRKGCRALWINDEGVVSIALIASEDTVQQIFSVNGPGLLPVETKRVLASGTSATSILALY